MFAPASTDHTAALAEFNSSIDVPWAEDGDWTFGRRLVSDVRLEIARIHSDISPTRLVETLGQAVWTTTQLVLWRDRSIPAVPLEVQLATNLARDLADRLQAINEHFAKNHGPDQTLLQRAHGGHTSNS